MSNRVRPQKITSLSAADKARSKGRKITWIPPNGNGIDTGKVEDSILKMVKYNQFIKIQYLNLLVIFIEEQ